MWGAQVSRARIPWNQGHVQVCVARSSVLEDSVRQFARLRSLDLRKTFRFKFQGEPGIDAGGVARCVGVGWEGGVLDEPDRPLVCDALDAGSGLQW